MVPVSRVVPGAGRAGDARRGGGQVVRLWARPFSARPGRASERVGLDDVAAGREVGFMGRRRPRRAGSRRGSRCSIPGRGRRNLGGERDPWRRCRWRRSSTRPRSPGSEQGRGARFQAGRSRRHGYIEDRIGQGHVSQAPAGNKKTASYASRDGLLIADTVVAARGVRASSLKREGTCGVRPRLRARRAGPLVMQGGEYKGRQGSRDTRDLFVSLRSFSDLQLAISFLIADALCIT